MTGKRQIDYLALVQDAMRGIVRNVLTRVAETGLPGDHHFYISFDTRAPGVDISKRLQERYPEEMTIVLQYQFWQLAVNEVSFSVTLSFDNVPERLTVPLSAVRVFFDPSVPYGLQFEGSDLTADEPAEPEPERTEEGVERRPAALAHPAGDAGAGPDEAGKPGKMRSPRKSRGAKGEAVHDAGAVPAADASGPSGVSSRQAAKPKLVGPKPDEPANDAKVVELDKFRRR